MKVRPAYTPEFCCDEMRQSWSRFYIMASDEKVVIDAATWDEPAKLPINFCPFCGEKIEIEPKL